MEDTPTPSPQELQPLLELITDLHTLVQRLSALLVPEQTPPAQARPPASRPAEPIVLSARMREFLGLLCHPKGYTYKEIAAMMNVSLSNLRKWRDRIRDRYGPDGKTAIALWAKQNGLG